MSEAVEKQEPTSTSDRELYANTEGCSESQHNPQISRWHRMSVVRFRPPNLKSTHNKVSLEVLEKMLYQLIHSRPVDIGDPLSAIAPLKRPSLLPFFAIMWCTTDIPPAYFVVTELEVSHDQLGLKGRFQRLYFVNEKGNIKNQPDTPATVTFSGSPPNASMLAFIITQELSVCQKQIIQEEHIPVPIPRPCVDRVNRDSQRLQQLLLYPPRTRTSDLRIRRKQMWGTIPISPKKEAWWQTFRRWLMATKIMGFFIATLFSTNLLPWFWDEDPNENPPPTEKEGSVFETNFLYNGAKWSIY